MGQNVINILAGCSACTAYLKGILRWVGVLIYRERDRASWRSTTCEQPKPFISCLSVLELEQISGHSSKFTAVIPTIYSCGSLSESLHTKQVNMQLVNRRTFYIGHKVGENQTCATRTVVSVSMQSSFVNHSSSARQNL